MSVDDLIEEGYAALRVGDSAAARHAFDSVLLTEQSGAAMEGSARADYLDHAYSTAVEWWGSAYEVYRRDGAGVGAIRVARTLAYMYLSIMGDGAVGQGWLARATSLLADEGPCPESGWVSLNQGMFESTRQAKESRFREALAHAREMSDSSLEFASLAYLGASLVHEDRVDEGMLLLDEALAAVAGRDVDDFTVVEEIFCQLFAACEYAHDVDRADQWIRVGEDTAARRNLPAVAAFCRTHYGGLLTAAGRWGEADEALSDAVHIWGLGHSSLRPGALARLAELRVRQGRFEEAEQLLAGLDGNVEAARPLAVTHLERGEPDRAIDVLVRALEEVDPTSVAAGTLWATLVEARLASGNNDEAAAAADELASCAEQHSGPYLRATAAFARGRLCLAETTGDPCGCLREALSGFTKARTPLELAQSRFELAKALASEQPSLALAEARAALEGFEQLPAARQADAVAALMRSLGSHQRSTQRTSGELTKREAEVLELLGHGLTNPEIADRLFISRKTVEHHVSRLLAKLGLRSRSEAAVYATREKPAPKEKPAGL
jgi:DNA-binding CsgD family transcriptional regulator